MATLENLPETRTGARSADAAGILTCFLAVAGASAPAFDDLGAALLASGDSGDVEVATTPHFPREDLERLLASSDIPSLSEVVLEKRSYRLESVGPGSWILLPVEAASPERLALARASFRIATLEAARERNGAFLDALVRAAAQGIVTADSEGCVTFVSESAARLLGVTASEAVGRPAVEILKTPKANEDLAAHGREGRVEEGEMTLVRAGGRPFAAGVTLEPLRDARGEGTGVLVLLRDLEHAKRLEERARTRERMASLGELSAAVAHEVRNPLTSIAASAQILRRRLSAEDAQAALLDVIVEETARLNRIVENMLQFGAQPRPKLVYTELPPIIERVILLVTEAARAAGVQIERDVALDLPAVYADPDQIEQVLLNVARNAVQSMPGGGVLQVTAAIVEERAPARRLSGRRASDGYRAPEAAPVVRSVEIAVTDTGCGIREEDLPRVFDPFFTTRREGTGLGLSISQGIVQAHDGYLRIASRVGSGTRVMLGLPVERRRGERRSR